MISTAKHWFEIEQVVSAIHAQLEVARAEAQKAASEPTAPPYRASPVEQLPEHSARQTALPSFPYRAPPGEPLFGRPLAPAEASASAIAIAGQEETGVADYNSVPEAHDIAALRIQIRERLTWLRAQLGEDLSAREAFHILFPLVIHIDELTAVALGPRASDWRSLQMEFFDIDDGGEHFFQKADELLGKDDTHPLVFEVYYFCLDDGFVGRFGASPSKLDDYKARLAARIPTQLPPVLMDHEEVNEVRLVEFPRRYYLISAGAVLLVFALLHLLSALEHGIR